MEDNPQQYFCAVCGLVIFMWFVYFLCQAKSACSAQIEPDEESLCIPKKKDSKMKNYCDYGISYAGCHESELRLETYVYFFKSGDKVFKQKMSNHSVVWNKIPEEVDIFYIKPNPQDGISLFYHSSEHMAYHVKKHADREMLTNKELAKELLKLPDGGRVYLNVFRRFEGDAVVIVAGLNNKVIRKVELKSYEIYEYNLCFDVPCEIDRGFKVRIVDRAKESYCDFEIMRKI